MDSVLQKDKCCWLCGTTDNLHSHHVYGASNRNKSEKYGLKVWLCLHHHTEGKEAIHRNRAFELNLKEIAQNYYEENIGTRERFIKEFGRCYL